MGQKSRLQLVGVGVVIWALAGSFAVAANLEIKHIMVTQCIQDENDNTIPLVSGRWTAVRVRVESPDPTVKVTGKLTVTAGGKTITTAKLLNTTFKPPAHNKFSWEEQDHTLNFEIYDTIPSDTSASFKVEVKAVPASVGGDTKSCSLACEELSWPEILYVRIHYKPVGGLPQKANVVRGKGDAFLQATWPIRDDFPSPIYRESANSSQAVSDVIGGDDSIDPWDDVNELLGKMQDIRNNFVSSDAGLESCSFVYGWVNDDVLPDEKGWSIERVGFGTDDKERCQRTFAHEMGHMVGLDHPATVERTDMVGWDVGDRLGRGRLKRKDLFDVMVPKMKTDEAWVSSKTYKKLRKACINFPPPPPGPAMPDGRVRGTYMKEVLFVQGVLRPDGKALKLEPIFRYPWRTALIPEPDSGEFLVEVEGENGKTVTRQFTGLVQGDDGNGGGRVFGFFCVTVPFEGPGLVKEVRVRRKDAPQGAEPLCRVVRLSNIPGVEFQSPVNGSLLGGLSELKWSVVGKDPKSEGIQYHVLLSRDGGKSFFPLAVRLRKEGLEVDWKQVLEAIDGDLDKSIVIRLIASDGLNTFLSKDVTGLSFHRSP